MLLLARVPIHRIAQQLHVSPRTIEKDVEIVRQEWRSERVNAYEKYMAEDLQRLAALEKAMWVKAMEGSHLAVDRVLAIIVQRGKLLGLEAPIRAEVTVLTEQTVDDAIRRLQDELEQRRAGGGAPIEAEAVEAAPGGAGRVEDIAPRALEALPLAGPPPRGGRRRSLADDGWSGDGQD
jgi:hypothetical protein